jgi:hypothetical protein
MTDEWHTEREEKFSRKMQKNSQKIVKFTARNLRQIQGGSGVLKRATKNRYKWFFEG